MHLQSKTAKKSGRGDYLKRGKGWLLQMAKYYFQILWTLLFQFLKEIFDETKRSPVKTLRGREFGNGVLPSA